MQSLLFLFTVLLILSVTTCEKLCQSERFSLVDNCVAKLFMAGDHGSGVPKNSDQLVAYCLDQKKNNRCLKSFTSQCLQPFPRQLSLFFSRAALSNYNRACSSETSKSEFLKNVECIDNNRLGLNKCMNTYIDDLEKIQHANLKEPISSLCCLTKKFNKCMKQEFEKVCTPEAVDYLVKIVEMYSKDLIICTQWLREPDKCNILPPLPDKRPSTSRKLSPYLPLMEVLINL